MLKFNEKKPIKTFLPKYESTMSIKSLEAKRKPSKAVTGQNVRPEDMCI